MITLKQKEEIAEHIIKKRRLLIKNLYFRKYSSSVALDAAIRSLARIGYNYFKRVDKTKLFYGLQFKDINKVIID